MSGTRGRNRTYCGTLIRHAVRTTYVPGMVAGTRIELVSGPAYETGVGTSPTRCGLLCETCTHPCGVTGRCAAANTNNRASLLGLEPRVARFAALHVVQLHYRDMVEGSRIELLTLRCKRSVTPYITNPPGAGQGPCPVSSRLVPCRTTSVPRMVPTEGLEPSPR